MMVVPGLAQDLWFSWMCSGCCVRERECMVSGTMWTKGFSLPKNGVALPLAVERSPLSYWEVLPQFPWGPWEMPHSLW